MPPSKPQQTLDLAVRQHQAGRLSEAELLYRQVLAQQPNHVDALHLLGVVHQQTGRLDDAEKLIRRAIALRPNFAEAFGNLGNLLRDKGQVDDAIAAYRRAIALKPNFADAQSNLGNALRDKGQLDEAIAAYRTAITLRPNFPDAHNNLGNALKDKGQLAEAIAAYRRAITCRPDFVEAHANLGVALREFGQFDAAIAACRQAIALRPNFAEAHNNLANALNERRERDLAIASYRQAIALRPGFADAHTNLGNLLTEKGQLDEAIIAYHQAIAVRPTFAEAYANLGNALREKGQLDDAVVACRQAIALRPDFAGAYCKLGNVLQSKREFYESIAAYRQAIALRPTYAEAFNNLGTALKETGRLDEAIAAYRQAISLDASESRHHSNLAYILHFHPAYSAPAIAEEHRRWNRQHAEPLAGSIQVHSNNRDPNRKLRIGYVSPDFREHCQSLFTISLLSHHDHSAFEIVCYSSVDRRDEFTTRIAGYADRWRDVATLDNPSLCDLIRADGIDILVDLTMHMSGGRLPLFARKPAPVQVAWLAYPASTGLTAIDYRLSDPYLDPPGMDESIYSERTIRLSDSFWCYDPLDGRDIPVSALPALKRGIVTFGCLNNFCKFNDGVLSLWAKVMRSVENSRLLLLSPPGTHRSTALERFAQEGIDPARIEFIAHQPRRKYLQTYHRIDLGLDTFPYNGHTTSLDSFWMGVPVITLVGQTSVARAGWCQLSNLGLTDLAAQSREQFVEIATKLAGDLPRLSMLRTTLRERMQASPLMDGARFARNVEATYRQMWNTWSETASPMGARITGQ
jgi:predicted O-linked N-acetylglucosamine transferase (SPINDLY family)